MMQVPAGQPPGRPGGPHAGGLAAVGCCCCWLLIRFDAVENILFKANIRRISDYARLQVPLGNVNHL